MSNKKKSSSSTFQKIVIGAIGVGLGFLANAIFKEVSKQNQIKPEIKPVQQVPQQRINRNIQRTAIDNYDKVQECMTCPITAQIMKEPAILTSCGHVFQKSEIKKWVRQNNNCPMCKTAAHQHQIKDNFHLREIIQHYQMIRNGNTTN